ncbi:hypothetical protein CRE_27952 [Caenorhabditis remanei]|uniref:Glycosyltransferase family 92 protein n=1 Tax=Caenorhabditis remanei TaxID=31234 RepID=E3NPR2_CAERE|nr:hypothetical protein CRE_27952 [Caenorhabditis remanei]
MLHYLHCLHFGSFLYISVPVFSEKVYCRYYNCLREEISNSSFQSIFFPMNVIRCPRRIGVKYMSISFDSEEIPQEPIPLVYRVFEAPIHEISVCVGPIYGSESKWLEVAEFIEHYKLIGVRYFYFTVLNMNEYSRKIIDEYLRTGEIKLTVIQSEYKFHLLQINENQRSKHHSKWVINVDIDERLFILNDKIKSVGSVLSGYNDTVAEVGLAIRRIQKTEKLPEKYESDEQIISEMEFLKYNVSSPVTWGAYKTIYRPEKIAAMYYHWAYQKYPGTVAEYVKSEVALFRHYRTTEKNILGSGWLTDPNYKNFSIVPEETKFAEKLKENVLKKIEYVYDQRVLYCEEIAEIPYEEYKEFGHDIFNCTFRNETGNLRNGIPQIQRVFSSHLGCLQNYLSTRKVNCFKTSTSLILISHFCLFIAAMYYHWAYQRYPGSVAEYVKSEVQVRPLLSELLRTFELTVFSSASEKTQQFQKIFNRHTMFHNHSDSMSFFISRHYRTTEKNILGSGWLTDPNYKNFSIVQEETKFAEKLKENVLKKIKYVYDQRVLYCEEIAEIPYEEYKEFGHDIFNCTFRNETASNKNVD